MDQVEIPGIGGGLGRLLIPARGTPKDELFGGEVYASDTDRYEMDALSGGARTRGLKPTSVIRGESTRSRRVT